VICGHLRAYAPDKARSLYRAIRFRLLTRSIHDERMVATLRCQTIGFNAEGAEER
jgi:hypothetical protein